MKKIAELDSFEKAIMYRAICGCMDADHDITLDLELDKKSEILQLHFFANVAAADYFENEEWLKRAWWRIKTAWKVLVKGEVKQEEWFTITDERQCEDFFKALSDGAATLKRLREKRNSSQK